MHPLPRFLATTLFVVLAALLAVLSAPAWKPHPDPRAPDHALAKPPGVLPGAAAPPVKPDLTRRVLALAQTTAFMLAVAGVLLALALVVVLLRSQAPRDPVAVAVPGRLEMGALAQLAATTVARDAELSRERDVRRRAEEDAQLKQQLLTHSLEEKIRLGHDLHDGIIQSLYALGLTVETVRNLLPRDPAEADRQLEQMRAGLNNTIRDVRAYITGLTPENLRRAGFAHAVSALLAELGANRAAEFETGIDDAAAAQLSAAQSLELLQIAREAVSNALRHGEATRIRVQMQQNDGEVCLLVQDNGRGFNPQARRPGGHGLGNMEARATRIGARVRITSRAGEGTRVVATVSAGQPTIV